jgi:hypothetical protein
MTYQQLKKECVKGAYFLTQALLENNTKLVELETFKLNNNIADMLNIIKKENIRNEQDTTNPPQRISENFKKWR